MRCPNCILPLWTAMHYFITSSVCFFLSFWKKVTECCQLHFWGIEIVHFGIDLQTLYKPPAFYVHTTLFWDQNDGMGWNGMLKKPGTLLIALSPRHNSAFQLFLQKACQADRSKPAFNLTAFLISLIQGWGRKQERKSVDYYFFNWYFPMYFIFLNFTSSNLYAGFVWGDLTCQSILFSG